MLRIKDFLRSLFFHPPDGSRQYTPPGRIYTQKPTAHMENWFDSLEGSLAMSKSRGSYPGSPPLGLHAANAIRHRLHDARSETVKCSIIWNRELQTKSSSAGNTVKHTLAGERTRTFLWGAVEWSARPIVGWKKWRAMWCVVCSHSCFLKSSGGDHICTLICKCIKCTFLWKGKGA